MGPSRTHARTQRIAIGVAGRLAAALAAASVATAIAMCSPFSGESDGPSSADGGDAAAKLDASAGIDGAAVADGASALDDAGVVAKEGGCYTLVKDDFTSPNPNWKLSGAAVFDAGLVLVPGVNSDEQGGAFFAVASPASSFTASFVMGVRKTNDTTLADGVALAWATDVGKPALGASGGALAFCPGGNALGPDGGGPNGTAIGFSVYMNNGYALLDPSAPSSGTACNNLQFTKLTFMSNNAIVTNLSGGKITGTIGSVAYNLTAPRAFPIRWIGFTGATGGDRAAFSVGTVTITACD